LPAIWRPCQVGDGSGIAVCQYLAIRNHIPHLYQAIFSATGNT
jgi:hypothetical protein